MMLTCAAWTLLLLPPAAAPVAIVRAAATQPATPASVSAGKDERADQAATYYSRGRYVEAALEFEGLWRDFPGEPRFLFNAAASRYSAGHYAHTVAYLGEYLGRVYDEVKARPPSSCAPHRGGAPRAAGRARPIPGRQRERGRRDRRALRAPSGARRRDGAHGGAWGAGQRPV